MPVALLLIGVVLIVVAFNNTMGDLAKELTTDIPGYFVWAVAIGAILALGYIPALRTPSRWLLALVITVIVLTRYKQIIAGFQSFATSGGKVTGDGPQDPATAYGRGTGPTVGQVEGTSVGGSQPAVAGAGGAAAGAAGGATGGLGAIGDIFGAAQGAAGAVGDAGGILNLAGDAGGILGSVEGFGGGFLGALL